METETETERAGVPQCVCLIFVLFDLCTCRDRERESAGVPQCIYLIFV